MNKAASQPSSSSPATPSSSRSAIDNLFVFLLLFQGFEISRQRQHNALALGSLGRRRPPRPLHRRWASRYSTASSGSPGSSALFLLYAASRLLRGGSAHAVIPEWIRRLQPASGSLLPVILAVEFTDLLFATDSIPAVLAVTHNPFIAYTSNIAAVLGLRSLYFALAAMLDRFRYLHYGLGALLGLRRVQNARSPAGSKFPSSPRWP